MLPCLATASAWTSTFHRPGAHSGARTLLGEETGFSITVRDIRVRHGESVLRRTFEAFPKDWKRSRLWLQSNTRELARWSITSVTDQMFFDASSGRAIFPDKS